jgi:hypothetical protein
MDHAHHEGMMHGHGGAAMGSMSGGMPVAFDWGTRVTLFFHSWATETTLDYLVALIGVFLLCVAQEHLFYFRTSLRLGEGAPARDADLSAPIVPKPYKCAPGSSSRVGCCVSLRRFFSDEGETDAYPDERSDASPSSRVSLTVPPSSFFSTNSVPTARQRAAGTFLYGANLFSSYLIMLAVMSCNAGVFFSVLAGLSCGHFLFASRRPVAAGAATSEACHPEY